MVKWLAIDTCTSTLGVGIADDTTVYGEVTMQLHRNHAERLLPIIDQLMNNTGFSLSDIGGVAVTYGPGSYTGVRVGVATAKTLAWSLQIPVVGISSLEALAVNGRWFTGQIVPMFDARRERVYSGQYRWHSDGRLRLIRHDRVVEIDVWLKELRNEDGLFLFIGDGADVYQSIIIEAFQTRAAFAAVADRYVRPSAIARIADAKWKRHGGDGVHQLVPQYLQVTEAERK